MQSIANGVNPTSSVLNCGFIIDAVKARATASDELATAPDEQDGTFDEIEDRFDTDIDWGPTFELAFEALHRAGDGASAIIGINHAGGGAHVVMMLNENGQVGIVEGQDSGPGNPREMITTPERAIERYGAESEVGIGIVGSRSK